MSTALTRSLATAGGGRAGTDDEPAGGGGGGGGPYPPKPGMAGAGGGGGGGAAILSRSDRGSVNSCVLRRSRRSSLDTGSRAPMYGRSLQSADPH